MRILISDMLYPEGHKFFAKTIIELLAKNNELTIVGESNYFSFLDASKYKIVNIKQIRCNYFEPLISLTYLVNLIIFRFKIRKMKYDKILFLSVRNDALDLLLPVFPSNKIAVYHHNDIDRIVERPIERFLFKLTANKIIHIVLADFIKEGLVYSLGVRDENVKSVYLPLVITPIKGERRYFDLDDYIVGLGRGTDDQFINEIIKVDKTIPKEKSIKYVIVLRSKGIEYRSNRLIITKQQFSRDEFESIFYNASACIAIYKESFKLRYSGTIDDALSRGKYVIGNDIPVIRYFENKYSGCVVHISSPQDLFRMAMNKMPEPDKNKIEMFKKMHSKEHVYEQLISALQ